MSNPFETEKNKNHTEIGMSFTAFITNQLESISVGESVKLDDAKRDSITTRTTASRAASKLSIRVITKTDLDGFIWAKRIK